MIISNFVLTKIAQARGCGSRGGRALVQPSCCRPPQPPPNYRLPLPPLQGVALGVSIAGAVAYLYFLARPYFAVTLAESRKVAELLSYLPLVDVGALMASAAGRGGGDGTSALQRTSSRSSDGETD